MRRVLPRQVEDDVETRCNIRTDAQQQLQPDDLDSGAALPPRHSVNASAAPISGTHENARVSAIAPGWDNVTCNERKTTELDLTGKPCERRLENGGRGRNRTADTGIFNPEP
ncbi:hypothetical protein [Xanthomonas arboricola]